MLVVLPIALAMGKAQNAKLRSKAGWVRYSDGMVSTITYSKIHSAPLARCRWYHGSSTRASTCGFEAHLVTGAPAILIEFPQECMTEDREWWGEPIPGGPVVAAVGFDPESRQAWQELLRDCGTPHDKEREKIPSRLSSSVMLLLGLLLIPLTAMGVLRTSDLIGRTLRAMDVPGTDPCGVVGRVGMACILLVLAYQILFLVLYTRRCCLTPEQQAAFTKVANRYKIGLLAIILITVVLPLLNPESVEEIVASAITLVLTGLVAMHFRFLVKAPKGEASE